MRLRTGEQRADEPGAVIRSQLKLRRGIRASRSPNAFLDPTPHPRWACSCTISAADQMTAATLPCVRCGHLPRTRSWPSVKEGGQMIEAFSYCPSCPHLMLNHDIESYEEPKPMCCVEGCDCGKAT